MKTLLTGIKPTGQPHLGNYIGAINPALKMIKTLKGKSFLFIADYHSLTSVHDPSKLSTSVYETACSLLACGLDTQKTMIYRQSDIPELFELYWILSCLTPKGLMNRGHSYKAQIQLNKENKKKDMDFGVLMGNFNYPILMSADILLFQADIVPVGEDQLQHLEMTRDIAGKFNHCFGSSLMKKPEPLVHSHHLPGLDGRKMSKSYNNHIPLFCSSQELKKKIMKIKTDSLPETAPKDPQTSVLFHLYKAFAEDSQTRQLKEKIEKGIGWGQVKQELFQLLDQKFQSQRKMYQDFLDSKDKVERILKEGAGQARPFAVEMLKKVRKTIGIAS